MDSSDESITELMVQKLAEERERQFREALLETDWEETAVLRLVTRHPLPFEAITPEVEVYRYEDRAPPVSHHEDGTHQTEVRTVTRPLLEQLSEAHPGVNEVLDDA